MPWCQSKIKWSMKHFSWLQRRAYQTRLTAQLLQRLMGYVIVEYQQKERFTFYFSYSSRFPFSSECEQKKSFILWLIVEMLRSPFSNRYEKITKEHFLIYLVESSHSSSLAFFSSMFSEIWASLGFCRAIWDYSQGQKWTFLLSFHWIPSMKSQNETSED